MLNILHTALKKGAKICNNFYANRTSAVYALVNKERFWQEYEH